MKKHSTTAEIVRGFKRLFVFMFWVVLFGGINLFFLDEGIAREEKVRCIELKRQELNYPLFYSTQAEREMCEKHDIGFNR